MAQKQMLKDRNTGVDIFPVTHESCIVTDDGSGVATKEELNKVLNSGIPDSVDEEHITMLKEYIKDAFNKALTSTYNHETIYDDGVEILYISGRAGTIKARITIDEMPNDVNIYTFKYRDTVLATGISNSYEKCIIEVMAPYGILVSDMIDVEVQHYDNV